MYKPNSLRQHLAAAIPELQRDPDRLVVFVDEGNVVATATASLSFEYRFTLNLIVTDYAGDADAIMVALIAWLKVHQAELMANEEQRKRGISFEVDFNNHETVDISIKLDLTERVIVKRGEGGRHDIKHAAEPQGTPAFADEFWTLYDGDTLLAEWQVPQATP
ncbi:phage tail protein [Janthinobacterium sp. GW460P]|uniref:phage tail protein n=1 Tax=unclassified Janthinobacterium TaxID=2610881 RepID=UPI000A32A47B|nr:MULTISPECIES: phage tail protein [unclassified Janthinobacterium]MCC7702250.1 phage tail protein [Janthinobacterium sp. GW460P]MCC7707758.1 phage tail protein [Janthinobacterium sp. GW460W]